MALVAVLAPLFALLPVAWLFAPSLRYQRGGGGKNVPVRIQVVDRATGAPIAGAAVRVDHPFRPDLIPPTRGVTGPDGRATLTAVARATSMVVTVQREALYHFSVGGPEHVSLSGGSVSVEVKGYRSARVPLSGRPGKGTTVLPLDPLPGRR
jgi:hypothetical protein